MKIALIVEKFPVLSETFIINQITGLIDRGHRVDIYSKSYVDIQLVHGEVKKYNLIGQTCYFRYLIPKNKIIRLIRGIAFIARCLFKYPIPLFNAMNIIKYGSRAASLSLLFEIMPFLEKGPYDIVHCHFGPNGKTGLFLRDLGAITGKIVTTFHGYDLSSYIKARGKNTYKRLFEGGDLFLTISERWKEELINLGAKEDKVAVHRMGVDTNKFVFSLRKPKKSGNIQLLTVARLVEKKGVKYGIQAVANVLKKYPKIEYNIVGDGVLKNELAQLINELNLNNHVKLLGWKEQGDIVSLMKDSDILLMPSVTAKEGDQEGIPVVLMEALAQGLPVLSTYHSGIPELIQDEVSGYLVHERDVKALSERLEYLVEHQDLWSRMGRAGRNHIENHYNIEKLNEQLIRTFQKLKKSGCKS